MPNEATSPHEVHARIISYFLSEVDISESCSTDPCGVIPFEHLIGVLNAIDTPIEYWDKVAMIVLDHADGAFCSIHYTENLLHLSDHVSLEVRDQIIRHFILRGGVEEVCQLLNKYHHRSPSQEEVLAMAKHNHHVETLSTSSVWRSLENLADGSALPTIKKMIAEVQRAEKNLHKS